MQSEWLEQQSRIIICPRCRFKLNNSFNICACSCSHEYNEQITKILLQPTNNTFVGDVCKNCGDIKNERLFGETKTHLFR
jgi:hypothetical protein